MKVHGGLVRCFFLSIVGLALLGPAAAGGTPPPSTATVTPTPGASTPTPTPMPVDFRSALKTAVDSSPELEGARSRVESARWATEQARSAGNPTLGLDGSYTHLSPEVAASLAGRQLVISPAESYKASLTLRLAVATFGRLHYSVLAGQMAERAALEEYRQLLANELATTADAYLVALLAREEVAISVQRLAARKAALGDSEALFEAGSVAKFDVLRVRSEATRARQLLTEARNAQQVAEARLASRMGQPPGTRLSLAPVDLDSPPPAEMKQAMEQALAQRPEILALNWAIEAARARLGLAESQDNPTLSLQSQLNSLTPTGMSPAQQWITGVVLSIPFYDGGAARAQAGQAREAMRGLRASLEGARRAVRLDVESSFLNLVSRWERIDQARQGLEEAAEAARVAEVRYAAGLSTSTELLDAQTALVQAQQALATARYGYLGAAVSWNRAISGEYPVEVPGPLLPPEASFNKAPTLLPPASAGKERAQP